MAVLCAGFICTGHVLKSERGCRGPLHSTLSFETLLAFTMYADLFLLGGGSSGSLLSEDGSEIGLAVE